MFCSDEWLDVSHALEPILRHAICIQESDGG